MSVYAIADLHGRLDLYQEVKKFLKPEDKVYFLGDAGDRGPDSWATIKAIYADPQFEYIIGNHEHMLLYSMIELRTGKCGFYVDPIKDLINNGGKSTLDGWMEDGQDFEWIQRLQGLLPYASYINESGVQIILSHAGYTPADLEHETSIADLVWNRDHIRDKWPKGFENVLIVHGHTPVQYFVKKYDTDCGNETSDIVWYGQGHKVDIDCGSVWSNRTCLFDLDTFDEHYFEVEPCTQEKKTP